MHGNSMTQIFSYHQLGGCFAPAEITLAAAIMDILTTATQLLNFTTFFQSHFMLMSFGTLTIF